MKDFQLPSNKQNVEATIIQERPDIANLKEIQKSQKYFTLTIIEGASFGCLFQLEKIETVIGRKNLDAQNEDQDSDIQLDDERVSRRHLLLAKRQDPKTKEVYVVAFDLDSSNGTYVNDKQIVEEIKINNGDKIFIGNTLLKFEIQDQIDIKYHERLYQQVTRDEVTGLWNHNFARQQIDKLVSKGAQPGSIFSLILIEIDFFQNINETFGREVGDGVLRLMGTIISENVANDHTLARFAAKQYLLLLPEIDLVEAGAIAENVRKAAEAANFSAIGCPQKLTVSIGVTEFPLCGRNTADLIKLSDDSLYKAKQIGRNCIVKTEPIARSTPVYLQKALTYMLTAIVIAGLVGGGVMLYPKLMPNQNKMIFSGLVESREAEVGSKVGGRVQEILVQEGQIVTAGTPLVRFDITQLLNQRSLLESRVAQVAANVAKLQAGNRPEEIAEAEANARMELASLEAMRNGPRPQELGQAEADLAAMISEKTAAEASFKRLDQLYSQGLTSKQLRDDAEARFKTVSSQTESMRQKFSMMQAGNRKEDLTMAEERYQKALARSNMMKFGTRREDLAEAIARLKEAELALEEINIQISEGEVKAPTDSNVEAISISPGDLVTPNRPVAKLLQLTQVWVRIFIPEPKLGQIKIGQKVNITIDNFPNRRFPGTVQQVANQGEFLPRNVQTREQREYQVFGVKIKIDNNDGTIKPGMSAEVDFE